VLIARGDLASTAVGQAKIEIRLTPAGTVRLAHSEHLNLIATATFTPTGSTPVTATTRFAIG
jgi:hypothetical protein